MARTKKRTAFTLIEVTLALLLGSSVVAVTGVVAIQSVQTQRAAREQVSRHWGEFLLFQQLETDVESAITWLPENVEPLKVSAGADELFKVYCLASVPSDGSLARRRMPARVTYRVETTADGSERWRIVREVQDLTDPGGSITRRILADELVSVAFDHHSANGWSGGVVTSNRREVVIDAVRLRCRFASHPKREVTRTILVTPPKSGGQSR